MLKEFITNTEYVRNALIGTILADGSILKERSSNYHDKTYIEITHTTKNLDYLKAKKELFEMLPDTTCSIKLHNKISDIKTYTLHRLSTNSTQYFKVLRDILYDEKRNKLFPKEIIDLFNEMSLLLLYLDDGTLRVRYYPGTEKLREARTTFCLDSFTYSEMLYFLQYLKNKYGINTKIYRHSKNMELNRGYRIWTNTENTKKFMEVINKFYNVIPSMNYKFLKFYSL